jgi:Glycosyl hydrolase catalytic core
MGNSTSEFGPTGTGFATGTSVLPTETSPEFPIDTAAAPVSDASACIPGSDSTSTIYSTDLITMTVTAEDTITVETASASAPEASSPYALSNTTMTSVSEAESSSIVAPTKVASSEQSSVDATTTAAETSSKASASSLTTSSEQSTMDVGTTTAAAETPSQATYVPSSVESISSKVIPATSSSPAETSDSPVASPATSYKSSSTSGPGGFYESASSSSVPPVSSSSAPVSSSAISTGSYGSSKRGLVYNSAALTNAFSGGSMGWAYNWAANPSGTLASGIEYVPMLWGQKTFSGWDAAAKSALASGAKHMLSFNEPDLGAQANMDSATAAAAHQKYMNPYASQAKIGSPAVTNGGPSGGTDGMGLGWLQKFFDKCAGNCKVDFVAFHWYDSAENVAYFKNYVQSVIDMAKKNGVSKVWLTEFGAAGSDDQVAKFLGEVLPWMDSNDAVERYAYFMCGDGKLVSGTNISDPVGKAYAA